MFQIYNVTRSPMYCKLDSTVTQVPNWDLKKKDCLYVAYSYQQINAFIHKFMVGGTAGEEVTTQVEEVEHVVETCPRRVFFNL